MLRTKGVEKIKTHFCFQ